MHDKDTDELMGELKRDGDIEAFLSDNEGEFLKPLSVYLNEILSKKQLIKSEIVAKSGLERTYAYHIFSGQKSKPARTKLLALSRAMNLSLDETQHLLRYAKLNTLYARDPWDAVIILAIERELTATETNRLLDDLGEKTLLR